MSVSTVFHEVVKHLDKLTLSELSQLHVLLAVRLGSWFSGPSSTALQKAMLRQERIGTSPCSSASLPPMKKPSKELAQQVSVFANDPNYIAMKEARKETIKAMKASMCKFWELSDTTLIGRNLLTRAKFDLLKQAHRKKLLLDRGESLESLEGAFINADLERMNDEQVAAMRSTALSQCAKLISRCGGVRNCRARADDCPQYIELSILTFKLTQSEFLEAMSSTCPDVEHTNCSSPCSNN